MKFWNTRLTVSALGLAVAASAATVDFARDVEPLLIKRCSECHGPDQQKAGLRLDSSAAALKGGKSGGPAIVPGQADESPLFQRVVTTDPDDVMPPKGDRLSERDVAALRNWINAGAVWPETDARRHWAFVKPVRPALPSVKEPGQARNEVDRFILARLEQEGLGPSSEADRHTLIRRLTLDLIGLPPTWAEVRDFVEDTRPDAYERVVDRLLASPQYGEQIARWWLDLARYADSNGYQVDLTRSIWPYRDWVINAFNRNQPFDQFTIEQLAGDLLPNASLEQRIATGFNRNTKINDEGGGDAEEYRTKAVKDRVATTATTWMGLTMMCAECHTHKYDPITHEEYFRFYDFFNHTADGGNHSVEPTLSVPAPNLVRQITWLRGRIADAQEQVTAAERDLVSTQAGWEEQIASRPETWVALSLTNVLSTGGSSYTNLADGSVLATGVNPIYDTIFVEATTELTGITAVLLEVLPDPSLPKNGPGRWGQTGNFILDEFAASAVPIAGEAPASTNLVFTGASADWEQLYYRAGHAVDRNPKTGWAIGPRFGQRHFLIAKLDQPAGFAGGTRLGFRFEHYHGSSHTVGRFRISVTTERDPTLLWPLPADVRALTRVPAAKRTLDQVKQLQAAHRASSDWIRHLEVELFRLNEREAGLASAKHSTLVMKELPEPRQSYIHLRGDFLSKGKDVTAGVPEALPALPPDQPANRLTLARWLVSPDNPLTARVTVNRLWERFFGTGLVKTSEDFGRQGEAPSHPDLLDWLAREFQEGGWDLKALQKTLVMSATYRQSAAVTPALLEKDLYNRLYARGPRFRLDAEIIRDQALVVSGLLNANLGGPSVHPVQVANLWKEIGFLRPEIGMDEWPVSEGPDLYRRGVYTFWRRVCTYPTFATFDAPSREVCTARRPRTNTPLQALAALNEPTLLEASRVFAERILREGGGQPAQQIGFAFRTTLGREPTSTERERLLALLEQQLRSFESDEASARQLLDVGSAPQPAGIDPRRLAAWMMVANVLLNLDEALTKG
ncbi:MAG: PSD1 and planctomycete cytochrome C domain-containing protein [Limisphaerales bacterium]